jgi:hypothetical protein
METPDVPCPKTFQQQPTAKRLCSHYSGIQRDQYLSAIRKGGVTVNRTDYSKMLHDKMTLMIQSVSKCVVLMLGNACSHTAETLQYLHFLIFEHPSYSPDPPPPNFHLFDPAKML